MARRRRLSTRPGYYSRAAGPLLKISTQKRRDGCAGGKSIDEISGTSSPAPEFRTIFTLDTLCPRLNVCAALLFHVFFVCFFAMPKELGCLERFVPVPVVGSLLPGRSSPGSIFLPCCRPSHCLWCRRACYPPGAVKSEQTRRLTCATRSLPCRADILYLYSYRNACTDARRAGAVGLVHSRFKAAAAASAGGGIRQRGSEKATMSARFIAAAAPSIGAGSGASVRRRRPLEGVGR